MLCSCLASTLYSVWYFFGLHCTIIIAPVHVHVVTILELPFYFDIEFLYLVVSVFIHAFLLVAANLLQ